MTSVFKCDKCGKVLSVNTKRWRLRSFFIAFVHREDQDFCSAKCLQAWITDWINSRDEIYGDTGATSAGTITS